MSDEEGKTRRNLMVFSTGVLAVASLGIPLSGSTFLGLNLKDVDPMNAWVCALVVLVYLTLRYWFDPTFQKQKTQWTQRQKETRERFSTALIRWSFRRWQLGRWWVPVSFALSAPPGKGATPSLEGYVEFKSELCGRAKIQWLGEAGDIDGLPYRVAYAPDGYVRFQIKLLPFIWIAARTIFQMLRINWILLEIAVPLGLSLAAGGYIILMIFVLRP